MKVGVRKPNIKASISARTTGAAKRKVKRAVIPGYGVKGTGWVKDPKKAAYNAVYSRTTVRAADVAKAAVGSPAEREQRKAAKAAERTERAVEYMGGNAVGWASPDGQRLEKRLAAAAALGVLGFALALVVPVVGVLLLLAAIVLALACLPLAIRVKRAGKHGFDELRAGGE